MRHACGITLQAIARRSPDVLKRHGALALPLAFLAMHQKSEGIVVSICKNFNMFIRMPEFAINTRKYLSLPSNANHNHSRLRIMLRYTAAAITV